MYLLDTNVLSELRRARPHGAVLAWLDSVTNRELFVPAVVIGEIQIGIQRTADVDAGKAKELSSWLDNILATSQCVTADAETFLTWGRLVHRAAPGLLVDALIAATAIQWKMAVVTRNVRDFATFDIPILNPFDYKI